MANLFDGLYKIALVVLVVILVLSAVIGIGLFYYMNVVKKKRKSAKDIDYSSFNRRDAKDYIQMIDDIKDDMIIADDMTRFIGVIECQGYDFYSAHMIEQGNTVQGYLGFINIIDKPITYRQYSKSVDLEYTIKKYLKAYDAVCEKLDKAINKLDEIQLALKKEMSSDRMNIYLKEQELTKRSIDAFEFRKFHLEDQLGYIDVNSGSTTTPLISSCYVLEWIYNPMEFSVDLSEYEILERAKNELTAQANAKISSLSNSGVKAKRCSTIELIDMCRRHSQPISSERYRIRDVVGSSYFEDITTSDSAKKINENIRKTLTNNATESLKEELLKMVDESFDDKDSVLLSAGSAEVEK